MLDRRTLLLGSAALGLAGQPARATGGDEIPLWPGEPPGGGGPTGPRVVSPNFAISSISRPTLRVTVPEKPNGAAVLVAAGGGYKRIGMGHEAEPAAGWLAALGITAFSLAYRLPGEGWNAGPLAPLQDAQRAIRLIRSEAGPRQLDPKRIGVLGFSAGGHLMGLAATRSAFRSYPAVDSADEISARPDCAALIYPVVTLEPPYDHTSTARALVGTHPAPSLIREWSVETHVKPHCPPMFLVNTADDPIADPANCRLLAAACRRAGVPVELHTFPTGGHGYGLGAPGTPTTEWPSLCRDWLAGLRMLG